MFMVMTSVSLQAQSWTLIAPMQQQRDSFNAATGSDGFVYAVAGGQQSQCLDSVEKYDPVGNYWTQVAKIAVRRCHASVVFGADGFIYVIGGNIGNQSTDLVERLDTATGQWQSVAPLNTRRAGAAVAVGPDLRIYVMGGFDSPSSTDVTSIEVFDGSTWTVLPINTGVPSPRQAVTGLDGNIYAFTVVPATVAQFDGSNWIPIGPLAPSNGDFAATTGPDGLMYLLGLGIGGPLSGTAQAYAYDTSASGGPIPNMLRSRGNAGGASVVDGRVIIAGGYSKSSGVMNGAESYGPLNAPLFSNARAWWRFNEPSGTSFSDSVSGNTGTAIGGAGHPQGRVENAVSLNGASQYVKVANASSLDFGAGDFTIEGWIRWSPSAGTFNRVAPILDKRTNSFGSIRGYHFWIYRGRLGVQLANGTTYRNVAEVTASVRPNQWTHVAVTIDRTGNVGTLYVDSVRVATFAPLGGSTTSFAPLLIGRNSLDGSLFRGIVDELTLYDRPLRWAEIRAVFLAGREGKLQ